MSLGADYLSSSLLLLIFDKSNKTMKPVTNDQIRRLLIRIIAETDISDLNPDNLEVLLQLPKETFGRVVQMSINDWQSLLDPRNETSPSTQVAFPKILEIFTRRVKVNRKQNPRDALDANPISKSILPDALDSIPFEGDEEVEVVFVRVEFTQSPDIHQAIYDVLGLDSDPLAVNQANIDDPNLVDTIPNICCWVDQLGNWYHMRFVNWVNASGRCMEVDKYREQPDYRWWLVGSRKIGTQV